jgi:glycosyltransferase involved in cell wall biosynthesis
MVGFFSLFPMALSAPIYHRVQMKMPPLPEEATLPAEEQTQYTIPNRYLLVSNIPCYVDPAGRKFITPLWEKDLREHQIYLPRLVLACPCIHVTPPADMVPINDCPDSGELPIVPLRASTSLPRAIFHLPATVAALWRAVGRAEVVHCGPAGWPIPLGWVVAPIAWLRRRFLVILVESAPWRIRPGMAASLRFRIKSAVYEAMARLCSRMASLAIFTHSGYEKSLLKSDHSGGCVIPASWIDEGIVLPRPGAEASWEVKSATPGRLRLLFAGRLQKEKGVRVLLEALRLVNDEGLNVELDILGSGDLRDECERLASAWRGPSRLRLLGTVPYGPEFFSLLQGYHAVVVPSLSDEQPRIVFDAYSQALPVLASRTEGLSDCIQEGVTGMLVRPGDADDLAGLIRWASGNKATLRTMGIAALETAHGMTHQTMHRRRCKVLLEKLGSRDGRSQTAVRSGAPA